MLKRPEKLGPISIGGSASPPPSPRLLKAQQQQQPVVAEGISQIATGPLEWPVRSRSVASARARR